MNLFTLFNGKAILTQKLNNNTILICIPTVWYLYLNIYYYNNKINEMFSEKLNQSTLITVIK